MRLGRRRAEQDAPEPPPELDRPATSSSPDPQGPRVDYARILDGESLWMAVRGTVQGVALRREGTSDLIHPINDAPPVAGVLSIRWQLGEALPSPAGGPEVYELVTLPGLEPLHRDPLAQSAPMRTPPSPDGRTQLELRRRGTGDLVIRRKSVPTHCPVVAVALTGAGVRFTFGHPGLQDPKLRLIDDAGSTLTSMPVTVDGDLLVGIVGADDLPADSGQNWFLAVTDGDQQLALRRARNDSAMPGQSTLLPMLWTGEGPELSLVRFGWQREGRVRINRPVVDDEGGS